MEGNNQRQSDDRRESRPPQDQAGSSLSGPPRPRQNVAQPALRQAQMNLQYDQILNALNNAISSMNRSTTASAARQVNSEVAQTGDPAVPLTHWCHDCQAEVGVINVDEAGEIKCNRCSGVFVEEKESDPNAFQVPVIGAEATSQNEENGLSANGLPIALQRRLDEESANRSGQNERLVQNILDMALSRIRANNSEFRNATLVGAQIRVRGGAIGSNSLREGLAGAGEGRPPSRLLELLMRDQESLYGNNERGVASEARTAELIARLRGGTELDGPVSLQGIPIGLLQLLLGPRGERLRFGEGQDQSLEEIMQHIMNNDPNNYGPPPASKSAIQQLQKLDIKTFVNTKTECCVCLTRIGDFDKNVNEMSDSEREIILMPCEHNFHQECLLPWLKDHNSCPSCRFELPTDDKDYENKKGNQPIQIRTSSHVDQGVGPGVSNSNFQGINPNSQNNQNNQNQ